MADRYWVGGTGTWSSTSTTNWSTSSGGAGGASVPTAADNVIFDAGSDAGGIFTVTMANSPRLCNDFTASGLDFTMTLAGTSIGLTVSGSLSFPATNFTRTYTGTTTFNATTTGKTITTNGVSFGGTVSVGGVGGAWTLGSAFSCGTSTLIFTNGTFDTSVSNYAVTAGLFSSSNSNIRTINLNASTVNLSSSSTAWLMTTSTNATLNAGTSTINLTSGSGPDFDGGGLTYYNVSFTSAASTNLTKSITGANTFNNLTFSTIDVAGLNIISIAANQTINGTLTVNGAVSAGSFVVGGVYTILTVGTTDFTLIGAASNTVGVVFTATGAGTGTGTATTSGNQRMFVRSSVTGISRTLTCAAIASMTDVDFRDITIAGAHGTLSGTRLGDCGGNSNITFVAGANKYWNLAAGGNWSATAWALSSGGAVAATNFPLAQDTVIIENTGLNTSATVTIDVGYNIGAFDMSTRSNAMTLSIISNPTFYENLIYNSAITPSGAGTIIFVNRSIKTFDTAGKTFDTSISIDAPSGGVQLINNNFVTGGGRTTILNQGTLDLNNFTFTTGVFSSSNNNTRSIAFGSTGSIVLTTPASGVSVLFISLAVNFTFTGTSNISTAMTVSRGFEFGNFSGSTESNRLNINLTSGASVPTFVGSFRQINFTGSTINPGNQNISCHGFTLASGGTYTSTDFITVGDGTLTSNGKVIDTLTVNGSGITTTLQDALTTATNNSTLTCNLTLGTLDLNGFTLTTSILNSSNSNTRSIAFGTTGSIVLSAASGQINLSMATATKFTFTGTSNISAAMSVIRAFEFGNFSGSTESNRLNINLTSGASVPTFIGSFRQINFTGSTSNPSTQSIICHGFTLASGGTYTFTDFTTVGDGTLTSNGKVINRLIVNGSGITTTLQDALTCLSSSTSILTAGTLDLNNFTFTTGIFSSDNSNTRSIAFGTTGSIVPTTTTAATTVLAMATATNFTFTGTSNITAAMSVTRTFNFGGTAGATTSNRLNINTTSGASVPTFTGSFRQINFTGSTSSIGLVSISCHGFTLASGGTYSSATFTTFGDGTLTHTGKATANLTINGAGITTTLADAGQTGTTTLTNGTLNLAGFTLTNTTRFLTAAGTKNLTFNGGTLVCSGSGTTAFNNASFTNFTTTAGTGTGLISMTSASTKTFVGGGSTFNCTLNQGGAGALTITGSNTFSNITNTVQPASVLFTAGTTSTFSNFSLSGTAGNLITIGSVTAASHTLSKASGTVSVSFCSISQSNATGGATWEALTTNGNVNGGNNTGWFFGFAVYDVFITEAASGIDSVIGRAAFSSALADTATATDSGVGFILFPALVADTATATDSVLSLAVFSSALAETATATDSVISFADFYAALAETATTTDSILSFADFYAALTETATATDSPLVAPSTFNAPVAETATATDAVSPPGSIYNAPVSETVTISDLVLGAYLWNLIDDSQSVTWQNVNSSPGTVWSPIDTDPDTGWSVIPTVN